MVEKAKKFRERVKTNWCIHQLILTILARISARYAAQAFIIFRRFSKTLDLA